MSSSAATNSAFASLGEEFCWHARHYAAIYGEETVGSEHLLLAAAEVTPLELHGCPQLNPVNIARVIAIGRSSYAVDSANYTPQRLSPRAQQLVAEAIGFSARTNRPPTLRDIWVAIAQSDSYAYLLRELGIEPESLHRQVAGL